ncbi:MAG: hypothetical protein HUU10_15235 [Bacteroidetes bacterium]|nr:hypothetical protein [Bacteroidota bacterium]
MGITTKHFFADFHLITWNFNLQEISSAHHHDQLSGQRLLILYNSNEVIPQGVSDKGSWIITRMKQVFGEEFDISLKVIEEP